MPLFRHLSKAVVLAALLASSRAENEIGFAEKFALAPDRAAALTQLIPASEEYYFYHALHFQNTGQKAKLAEIMKQWAERFPTSTQRGVIENRTALQNYDTDPQATLKFLTDKLNLEFNDERQAPDEKSDLPTKLDPTLITRNVYLTKALEDPNALGATEIGDPMLLRDNVTLSPAQRHILLGRITRPDVPNLVDLIAADLKTTESNGNFGEFPIHRALLPAQLEDLARRMPSLLENQAFINARVSKLAPSADVDIEYDLKEREAWLDRVWALVAPLSPTFNSLKANILYQRLDLDRTRGVYDQARFLEYLRLPRQTGYVNPKYVEAPAQADHLADLNASYAEAMATAHPIADDEPLVRDYFLHIFPRLEASTLAKDPAEILKPWTPFVQTAWLKPLLAEAMITNGMGEPERWASLLTPTDFQALKARVDVDFALTNPDFHLPAEEPALDLFIKNAPKLIVKIYEVNTLSYYLSQKKQLNTDLPLDGLVANKELTFDYAAEPDGRSPFRRVARHFTFPELKDKRGAWVIEFIGGGKSSRALIRKGSFTTLQHAGAAGDVITVLDEARHPINDASAWVNGRKIPADPKTGRILIPFSATSNYNAPLIVTDATGTFASLSNYHANAESYRLDATMHVQREQLLAGREATLIIRTALYAQNTPAPLELLQDVKLTLTSENLDGVATTTVIRAPHLESTKDFNYTFRVPDRLAKFTAVLTGQIEKLSEGGKKEDVVAQSSWSLNAIDRTDQIVSGHLSKFGGDYVYEVLGKNGEPLVGHAVEFNFSRQGFEATQDISLSTDSKGRIALGTLDGLFSFKASPADGDEEEWYLSMDGSTWPDEINGRAGQTLMVPWGGLLKPSTVSLLETRGDTFAVDRSSQASAPANPDGSVPYLLIKDLPPGDYSLMIAGAEVKIHLTVGEMVDGWAASPNRLLEILNPAPLQIDSVQATKEVVRIKLTNAGKFARVHVAATRFLAGQGLYELGLFRQLRPDSETPDKQPNLYAAGRDIGDEYRYILERRYAKSFPGNMLARPGLILNPWEVRSTDVNALSLATSEKAGEVNRKRVNAHALPEPTGDLKKILDDQGGDNTDYGDGNIDFLATSAPLLLNLVPDENGVILVDRAALGDRQYIQVFAEDMNNAAVKEVALDEVPTKFADQRLAHALDPQKPFTEKKEVTLLAAGQTLTLEDLRTSEMETYDSLGSIYNLFTTLSGDAKLAKFGWILQWATLKPEEKRAKYSEFASHELSFFLSRKDPAFFQEVILPYLRNKKDKTFMDDYLLGNDLKPYLKPWAFAQLNAAEQALLGRKLPEETASVARHLREGWELLPQDPERQKMLFDTALRGSSMQAGAGSLAASRDALAKEEAAPTDAAKFDAVGGLVTGVATARGTYFSKAEKKKANVGEGVTDMPTSTTAPPGMASAPVTTASTYGGTEGFGQATVAGTLSTRSEANGRTFNADLAFGEDKVALKDQDEQLEGFINYGQAIVQRQAVRQFFRALGPTKEWAENNYYELPITAQNGDLVKVNAFWRDYAAWDGKGAFLSAHAAEATGNFAEMMIALGVLDLPLEAPKNTTKSDGPQYALTAGGPLIAYHKEIKPASVAQPGSGVLLVSQNFYRHDDPFREEGNEKFEKYVTDEFLAGVVYGAKVVVTNPTSSPQKLDVLMQIPQGALPVLSAKPTDSEELHLEPYTTKVYEYAFYFPLPVAQPFPQFPVNVARDEESVAAAKPATFKVVQKLSQADTTSWDYVSQQGTEAEVFAFLEKANIERVDLDQIAWRAKASAGFFRKIIAVLARRHVYNEPLYRYAVVHNDGPALGVWLQHKEDFIAQCGPWLHSKLIDIDPIQRHAYEQLEYSPLVNQRTHRVGAENRIANPVLLAQYQALMNILCCKPKLDAIDQMSVVYYLFLQDRVEEALVRFHQVKPEELPTRLQHDYFRCYAAFYEEKLAEAKEVAVKYADYPVDRWRQVFSDVATQLAEIDGQTAPAKAGDGRPDREKQQGELAATEPAFDFKVENRQIALTWKNLREVTVNYYLMDPEFLFSSSPFITQDASRFSIIKPGKTSVEQLPEGKQAVDLPLPEEFAKANVLVEILGAGQRKSQAYHANTLRLSLAENYGRLDLKDEAGKAVSKAYVKVYARLRDGTVRFYKDGYTDLRGKFDYASLNSSGPGQSDSLPATLPASGTSMNYQMLKPQELNSVEKLALLIMSEKDGTLVREVTPPQQ